MLRVLVITLNLLIFTISNVFANTTQVQNSPPFTEKNLSEKIDKIMKQYNIPGMAIELYINGKPKSYYFGYANQEKKIPVTENTIFEIGSFTKLFTTLLIAEESLAGRINLQDPITKYVPGLQSFSKFNTITVAQLATHTSGLPFNVPESVTTRHELDTFLQNEKTFPTPGSQWQYSNMGIGLLGFALEEVTHESYLELYYSKILKPLNMHSTFFNLPKNLEPYYAQGYDKEGHPSARLELWLFPTAGALKSSPKDMSHFLYAAIGLPQTPKNILAAMQLTQTPFVKLSSKEQGLGWEVYPNSFHHFQKLLKVSSKLNLGPIEAHALNSTQRVFNSNALIDKTGATLGFRSYIALMPSQKTGIVLLLNRYVTNDVLVTLGRSILFDLGGQTFEKNQHLLFSN